MDLALRQVLRKIAFPVTIVGTCSASNDSIRAATISSWTTICLQPHPIVSISLKLPSRLDGMLRSQGNQSRRFSINILDDKQGDLAWIFSKPGKFDNSSSAAAAVSSTSSSDLDDRFLGRTDYYIHPETRLPIFFQVIAALHCEAIQDPVMLGDHAVWFARVTLIEDGIFKGRGRGGGDQQNCLLHWKSKFATAIALDDTSVGIGEEDPVPRNRLFYLELHCIYGRILADQHRLSVSNAEEIRNFCLEILSSNYHRKLHQTNSHLLGRESDSHCIGETRTVCYFWVRYFLREIGVLGRSSLNEYVKSELGGKYEKLNQIIMQYYSASILASPHAKNNFLEPDLKSLS